MVPPVESTLRQMCETYFHIEPLFVEPGIKTGMQVLVDNPTELGADRLADSIAAYERYGGPCIVVDFGTATKFEVISERGEYLGGVIAPGLGLSAEALFSRAARLSRVDIKRPDKVIGTNTIGHLQSGLYFGYIGLVDGILDRIVAELGSKPRVIASGIMAHLIAADSRYISEIDDMLTLDGLRAPGKAIDSAHAALLLASLIFVEGCIDAAQCGVERDSRFAPGLDERPIERGE